MSPRKTNTAPAHPQRPKLPEPKDLFVLVADLDMKNALEGLLSRPDALGLRQITYDLEVHVGRDSGCRTGAAEFLKSRIGEYRHVLVLFDHEGSGSSESREELENSVQDQIVKTGWGKTHVAIIVLAPELEIWVWSQSPHVDAVLGWYGRKPSLHEWLIEKNWLIQGENKPKRPKEALQDCLKEVRKPRSAALYKTLAQLVSLQSCTDRAFVKLRGCLSAWFGSASISDETA